ncbi:MAG: response regulator [Sarcina sp.]
MRKYKVLIADDEEEIRLGVIKKINWEELGFEVIGCAENGKEALIKCEILKPDIIFTDIKMPFMSGLELSEKLKSVMPWVKIIIFSGSNDFEFTKKAININVFDYILKPINSNELVDILQKLRVNIDLEYENKKNLELLYLRYNESLPILREKFLAQILEGGRCKSDIVEYGETIGIEFSYNYLATAIVNIDDNTNNRILLNISLQKTIEELLLDYCNFKSLIHLGNIIIIVELYNKKDIYRFIKDMQNICIMGEKFIEARISAGIGRLVNNLEDIQYSYKTAKDALHYKSILGAGNAIYIEDVERDTSNYLDFTESDERMLVNAIKLKSDKEIKKVIEDVFRRVESIDSISYKQYKVFIIELTAVYLKLIKMQNIDIEDTLAIYKNTEDFESIGEAKAWFIDKAIDINKSIQKKRIAAATLLVEEAKEYVLKNYHNNELSVDTICNALHLSPAYFSTIFKKEVGINFISYLTNLRLEKAKVLLKTTDYKTYIIAEKVGYIEANYFSYVFRKEVGVSPSKFRNV